MTKLYYTCPIKALYMSKEFEVKFYIYGEQLIEHNLSTGEVEGSKKIKIDFEDEYLNQILDSFSEIKNLKSRIYVAKESEHIFKPQELDIGFTSSRNQTQFNHGAFIFLELKTIGWSPIDEGRIIMRNNKQFFMPEVEK